MTPVRARGITIGLGTPKLVAPIFAPSAAALAAQATEAAQLGADMIEWREDLSPISLADSSVCLRAMGKAFPGPILYTLRSRQEGGAFSGEYARRIRQTLETGLIHLCDVELFHPDASGALAACHAHQVPVIGSFHDYSGTLSLPALQDRLDSMRTRGADVIKLAVTVQTKQEALALFRLRLPDQPTVVLAMGHAGRFTRVCGEALGCCLTFGALGSACAPGQIPIAPLRTALDALHHALEQTIE